MKRKINVIAGELRINLSSIREILSVVSAVRVDLISEELLWGVGNIADVLIERIEKMEKQLKEIEKGEIENDTL